MLAQDNVEFPLPPTLYDLAEESIGSSSIIVLFVSISICGYLTFSKLRIYSHINYNLRCILNISLFVIGWIVYQTAKEHYFSANLSDRISHAENPMFETMYLLEIWIYSFQIIGFFILILSVCVLVLNIREKRYNKSQHRIPEPPRSHDLP